jgi:hypothetical protein
LVQVLDPAATLHLDSGAGRLPVNPSDLPLRDVHLPPAPSWWPPAPGWWIVVVVLLSCILVALFWMQRRQRRYRLWRQGFDATCGREATPGHVAAMSELLRRAARRADADADRLQGEAWLRFLDGKQGRAFSEGAGRLLLEGGYRRDVDSRQFEQLRELARIRFLELMARRR